MNAYSPGLEGVIAGETAISTVGKKGKGLTYRGYAIIDLAEQATFEEVAYLLIHGRLPDSGELTRYRKRLSTLRGLPEGLKGVLEQLPPTAHPMDVLRTGCSALGAIEPEGADNDQFRVAERLLASFPSMLLYWHNYQVNGRRIATESGEESLAGHFLALLHGKKPEELTRRAVDVSLILYAEHEFIASTFSARVTASTLSDFHSAVTSAIGTLRGPLHGGANEEAMRLNPNDANVSTDLGFCYFSLNQVDRALQQFDHSLSVDPKHTKTLLNQGYVRAFGKQDLDGAMASWSKVIEIAPNSPEGQRAKQLLDGLKSAHPGGAAPASAPRNQ